MDRENYIIQDARLYLMGNSISPSAVDDETLAVINSHLEAEPCEVPVVSIEAIQTQKVALPTEGRVKELMDHFFSTINRTPEEAEPAVLKFIIENISMMAQKEAEGKIRLKDISNPGITMVPQQDYQLPS